MHLKIYLRVKACEERQQALQKHRSSEPAYLHCSECACNNITPRVKTCRQMLKKRENIPPVFNEHKKKSTGRREGEATVNSHSNSAVAILASINTRLVYLSTCWALNKRLRKEHFSLEWSCSLTPAFWESHARSDPKELAASLTSYKITIPWFLLKCFFVKDSNSERS